MARALTLDQVKEMVNIMARQHIARTGGDASVAGQRASSLYGHAAASLDSVFSIVSDATPAARTTSREVSVADVYAMLHVTVAAYHIVHAETIDQICSAEGGERARSLKNSALALYGYATGTDVMDTMDYDQDQDARAIAVALAVNRGVANALNTRGPDGPGYVPRLNRSVAMAVPLVSPTALTYHRFLCMHAVRVYLGHARLPRRVTGVLHASGAVDAGAYMQSVPGKDEVARFMADATALSLLLDSIVLFDSDPRGWAAGIGSGAGAGAGAGDDDKDVRGTQATVYTASQNSPLRVFPADTSPAAFTRTFQLAAVAAYAQDTYYAVLMVLMTRYGVIVADVMTVAGVAALAESSVTVLSALLLALHNALNGAGTAPYDIQQLSMFLGAVNTQRYASTHITRLMTPGTTRYAEAARRAREGTLAAANAAGGEIIDYYMSPRVARLGGVSAALRALLHGLGVAAAAPPAAAAAAAPPAAVP